jgi:hypothetical protein
LYRKSISQLPSADALTGDELIALVQDGKTKRINLLDSLSTFNKIYVSDTPPVNPIEGQLWFNTGKSRLYSWYIGASSSQWIQV